MWLWVFLAFLLGLAAGSVGIGFLLKPSLQLLMRQKVRLCRITKVRLFQDPSVIPGKWHKARVFGYDDLNEGWVSAAFEEGMDFIAPRETRLSTKHVNEEILALQNIGYQEIGCEHATRYGFTLNEICVDDSAYRNIS